VIGLAIDFYSIRSGILSQWQGRPVGLRVKKCINGQIGEAKKANFTPKDVNFAEI